MASASGTGGPGTESEVPKLNLACGSDYRHGWLNLDIIAWPGWTRPDRIWDARRDPLPVGDGEADEIYCGYTISHIAPGFHKTLLAEIYRALSPLGFVVFSEVDMPLVMAKWMADPRDARVADLIWGEQGNQHGLHLAEYDKHCQGFTEETLGELLTEVGFRKIRRVHIHSAAVWWELSLACEKGRGDGL